LPSNEILEGEPRLGWLFDGNEATPEIAVLLRDVDRQIILAVPTKGLGSASDPYGAWFDDGLMGGTLPSNAGPPPNVLHFQDHSGHVILVGCRPAGMRANLPGTGTGSLVADFAVLGARSRDFEEIHALRTEMPALNDWVGIQSVNSKAHRDNEGLIERVEVELDSPSEISLARRNNLTLVPSFTTSSGTLSTPLTASNVIYLRTSMRRPVSWFDHLRVHRSIRDLLVIAGWEPVGFSNLETLRRDDPETTMSGSTSHEAWRRVRTYQVPLDEGGKRKNRFLFRFIDIGPRGVHRWLRLREHFSRGLDPLLLIADQKMSWESRMVQSGMALEAIGYQIAVDQGGIDLNSRKQLNYKPALRLILNDMPFVPLDDEGQWIEDSSEAYSGVKHADNELPEPVFLANTLRTNLLVLRYWIAGRLGCPQTVLTNRLAIDPHSQPYVPV